MIRTFVVPSIIVLIFLGLAATLMATAPGLEPSSETPKLPTVRVSVAAEDLRDRRVVVPVTAERVVGGDGAVARPV